MIFSKPQPIPRLLAALLCCSGLSAVSNVASAAMPPAKSIGSFTQIGRYTVIAAGPTSGQRDLLSVTTAINIPGDLKTVGEALHWLLRDSGYRLAADSVLSDEVKAMLKLPLPSVHRRFEPMPIKTVIALIVGPAFHLVQDPVHRLIAFERCGETPEPSTKGETH